jgi:hypothetical protein
MKIMVGTWEVNVTVGAMPEVVATAFAKLNELVGAEYTPIAYLGSQVVNGTNYAVLAEQLLMDGKDTKNVVLVIFNQKPGQIGDASLVSIERVVEQGMPTGGAVVDVKTDIPADAKAAFDAAFEGYVGVKVEPFALLGTQVVKGTDYIFAAEVTPIVAEPVKYVALVTVNGMVKSVNIVDILNSNQAKFGYAFTWLK